MKDIMKPILTVSMVFLACAVTLTGRTPRTGPPASGAAVLRTVYFSAVDGKGAHVTDLTAADLMVKEGGKDRVIDDVKPATAPMQISLLVDDGGTGGFQNAVAQFIQATFGRAEYAIRVLSPQAIRVVDFTKNGDELRTALGRMGQRGRIVPDDEQIIAGVFDAAKELRQREARRPSIVALTATGEKALADTADETLNALKASGASLSVLYITGVELGKVLGDGPRQSGGIIEQVTGNLVQGPALAKVAANLLNQYVLTYTVPDGVKLNEKLSLTTTRKGVKLIAPSKLPDK
jgi:hypothetical protein